MKQDQKQFSEEMEIVKEIVGDKVFIRRYEESKKKNESDVKKHIDSDKKK